LDHKEHGVQVNESAMLTLPLFVKDRFGEPGLQRWLEVLPPDVRPVSSSAILAPGRYPLREGILEPTEKLCDLFYQGRMDGAGTRIVGGEDDKDPYSDLDDKQIGLYPIVPRRGTDDSPHGESAR
jgi:hypothetical protein